MWERQAFLEKLLKASEQVIKISSRREKFTWADISAKAERSVGLPVVCPNSPQKYHPVEEAIETLARHGRIKQKIKRDLFWGPLMTLEDLQKIEEAWQHVTRPSKILEVKLQIAS